jgi:hypothetical protein
MVLTIPANVAQKLIVTVPLWTRKVDVTVSTVVPMLPIYQQTFQQVKYGQDCVIRPLESPAVLGACGS